MAASQKKVIVRTLSRHWHAGYLPQDEFAHEAQVSLLDLSGKLLPIPLPEIKWICFVREFTSGDITEPERLLRKSYSARPRTPGLWLRVRLRDQDVLEGMAQNDVSLLEKEGLFLIPPDTRSNTQRIFLPRETVVELEVVAVIRSGTRRGGEDVLQESLFKAPNGTG